jgi:HK97 family phage major capsid protein
MSDDLIKRLSEQRLNVWEQAKAINETVLDEKRDFSAEEEASWVKANADLDSLDERIRSLVDAEKRSADTAATFESIERRPQVRAAAETETGELRSFLSGETRSLHVEARDLTKSSATAGGNTVPTSFAGSLYEHMIEVAALLPETTIFRTAGGENLEVPITTTHATAALIAEAGSLTESDAAFGKRTLGAYKYAYSFQIAKELLEDTGVDLNEYFARAAGRALGNAFGNHLAVGTGTAQPSGVTQTSTLGVTGAASVVGVPNGDNLVDLFYSVIAPYRNSPNCVWAFRDTTAGTIRKIKDSSGGAGIGNYLWTPGFGTAPDTILGKRVVIEPNIAATALSAKSVVFGDMSAYFSRLAGGIRFERSDEFAFQNDLVTFRAVMRADGILGDQTGAVKHFIGNAA